MLKKWKFLDSQTAFDNKWMMIKQEKVELPNGKILDDYFVWEEGEVAMVVPITANGELVMVRQYKHAYGEICTEFPAGWINENESAKAAANRELQEETGFTTPKMELLKTLTNMPTKVRGKLHIFLAQNVVADKPTNFDEVEDIETLVLPVEKVAEMINRGEIMVTGTISAFYLAAKKMGWKV